jgi:hypothetical protein
MTIEKQLAEMQNYKIKAEKELEDLRLEQWRAKRLRENIAELRNDIETMGRRKTKKDILEHINNILIYY